MSDTKQQIEAIKANVAALKEPLRKRYWEIEALRKPHLDKIAALQAERDANIDNLTPAQDRALIAKIKDERVHLAGTDEERKDILRALRDEDGKLRLGSA